MSCAAERHICSVCGTDRRVKACHHVKGRRYDGKQCFLSLEDISDAYEWSFVAVPAQVGAGVTKGFEETAHEDAEVPDDTENKVSHDETDRSELEKSIRRALAMRCPDGCAKQIFDRVCGMLDDSELEELGKAVEAGKSPKVPERLDEYLMQV